MDHHVVADVNAHMTDRPRRVISASEKDDVSRLSFRWGDMGALVVNTLGGGSGQIVDAAVGKDIADKPAAIKAGAWTGTAPDIREPQIFFRFGVFNEYVICATGQPIKARIIGVTDFGRLLTETEKGELMEFAFKEISYVI